MNGEKLVLKIVKRYYLDNIIKIVKILILIIS